MFKLLKIIGIMAIGSFFAPKKGVELRQDLVEYLKKYRPQIQKFINNLEASWEMAKKSESDEINVEIEAKLSNIKNASSELDAAKTKELAYKALCKIGDMSFKLGKEAIKSNNFKMVAKDLASISITVIDSASNMYSKAKDISTSFSEDVEEKSFIDKNDVLVKKDKLVKKTKKEIG